MFPSLIYTVLLPQHRKLNYICLIGFAQCSSDLMVSLQNLVISKGVTARDINGWGFNLFISTKEKLNERTSKWYFRDIKY